jgi:hypothetical protein
MSTINSNYNPGFRWSLPSCPSINGAAIPDSGDEEEPETGLDTFHKRTDDAHSLGDMLHSFKSMSQEAARDAARAAEGESAGGAHEAPETADPSPDHTAQHAADSTPNEEEGGGALETAGKVLGPAGAVLGILQIGDGLKSKDGVDKTLTVGAGAANTVAGAGLAAEAFGLTGSFATGLAGAAGAAGGVGAILGGADTLYNGIKSHNKLEIAGGAAETVGGGIMTASLAAGLAAPLVFGVGAAVYAGGLVVQHFKGIEKGAEAVGKGVAHGAEDVASGIGHVFSSIF